MTKTIIRKYVTSGMDWHDTRTATDYVEENGSWFITDADPEELISADIHKELVGMNSGTEAACSMPGDLEGDYVTLTNILSLEEVAEHVKAKKPFTVTSDKKQYSELSAEWEPDKNLLQLYYSYGQFTATIGYRVDEIPDEKLCFLPVETFYAPTKGVDAVQRMRARLFTLSEEAEAKKAFDEINEHLWGTDSTFGSSAEMIICNVDSLGGDSKQWYETNLEAFRLREQHPEVEGYRVFAGADVEYLKEQIKAKEGTV